MRPVPYFPTLLQSSRVDDEGCTLSSQPNHRITTQLPRLRRVHSDHDFRPSFETAIRMFTSSPSSTCVLIAIHRTSVMSAQNGSAGFGPPGSGPSSNTLPDLGSLRVADQDLNGRRLYEEAKAARETATGADIEALGGIKADPSRFAPVVDQESHDRAVKRMKLNGSVAYKILRPRVYGDQHPTTLSSHPGANEDDDEFEGENGEFEGENGEFDKMWAEAIKAFNAEGVPSAIQQIYYKQARRNLRKIDAAAADWVCPKKPKKKDRKIDLIASLCTSPHFLIEIGKHMPPKDIIKLYSVSRDFHHALNKQMKSTVMEWARSMAPNATRVYDVHVYDDFLITDPLGRLEDPSANDMGYITLPERAPPAIMDNTVRKIWGLRWLSMVVCREIRVRDIMAYLARNGHRLPPGTDIVLKKIWLLMDASTNESRLKIMHNNVYITDRELVMMQTFFVKLNMLFNDPITGPSSTTLTKLFLGQRGLTPLWKFLRGKRYRDVDELIKLKIVYDVGPNPEHRRNGIPFRGVPVHLMGIYHLEGWGTGRDHLMRPDELLALECARRQLPLDNYIRYLMRYGHMNPSTGTPEVPSVDELYMSDPEMDTEEWHCHPMQNDEIHAGGGNVPFEEGNWKPKHARKARWDMLPNRHRKMILRDDARELDGEISRNYHQAWSETWIKDLTKFFEKHYLDEDGKVRLARPTRLPDILPSSPSGPEGADADEEDNGDGYNDSRMEIDDGVGEPLRPMGNVFEAAAEIANRKRPITKADRAVLAQAMSQIRAMDNRTEWDPRAGNLEQEPSSDAEESPFTSFFSSSSDDGEKDYIPPDTVLGSTILGSVEGDKSTEMSSAPSDDGEASGDEDEDADETADLPTYKTMDEYLLDQADREYSDTEADYGWDEYIQFMKAQQTSSEDEFEGFIRREAEARALAQAQSQAQAAADMDAANLNMADMGMDDGDDEHNSLFSDFDFDIDNDDPMVAEPAESANDDDDHDSLFSDIDGEIYGDDDGDVNINDDHANDDHNDKGKGKAKANKEANDSDDGSDENENISDTEVVEDERVAMLRQWYRPW